MCDIMKFYISCSLVINGNKVVYSLHYDPARLHLLRKTCWIDPTLGSPDLTVRLNAYTLYSAPARIMQNLELVSPVYTHLSSY